MARFGDTATYYGNNLFYGQGEFVVQQPNLDSERIPVGGLRLDLFDPQGNALGGLFTAEQVVLKRVLDQISKLDFAVPATEPQTAKITDGTTAKVYHKTLGYLGQYILRPQGMSTSRLEWKYTARGIMQELAYVHTGFNAQYNNIAMTSVLSANNISGALYGLFYGTGWLPGTIDGGLANAVVVFDGNPILDAIATLAKRYHCHFRDGATARTLDFGTFGTDTGYRLFKPNLVARELQNNPLIGIVLDVQENDDPEEVWNQLTPVGGGQGTSRLTLQKSTRTTPYAIKTAANYDGTTRYYIQDDESVNVHGGRATVMAFTSISPLSNSDGDVTNAANALYDAAVAWLQWYKDMLVTYIVTATQVPTGLKVGDKTTLWWVGTVTRRGQPFSWKSINGLFWVMDRTDIFGQDGSVKTTLTLSSTGRLKFDDATAVVSAIQQVNAMQSFVQPTANRETWTYREEIANGHTVTIPIDIDSSVLYLTSAKVLLQTRPLRDTVLVGSTGSGSTVTSDIPSTANTGSDSTSSTSGTDSLGGTSGGSSAANTGNESTHTHVIAIDYNASATNTVTLALSPDHLVATGFSGNPATNAGSAHAHSITHTHNISHTHSISITHAHSLNSHTHTVNLNAHTHSLTYGVYDDTVYPNTISLSIDGIDRTTALGGPWGVGGTQVTGTTLDITTYLVNAAGGLRQTHTLVFSVTGGQGQILCSIKLRDTVQDIAVA